ncbi:ARABIDILLO 1-like protein [Drosera capensis]
MNRRVRRKVTRSRAPKGKQQIEQESEKQEVFHLNPSQIHLDAIGLRANGLRELTGDHCRELSDAVVSVITARHEGLESLQLGPDECERVTGDAIRAVAMCCVRLRSIRVSGLREVDEMALGDLTALRFLSVAGTSNLKWSTASHCWGKLPNLVGLDVSRTDIGPKAVSGLFSLSGSLRVLCALNCHTLEEDTNFVSCHNSSRGKLLLTLYDDMFKGLRSLFADKTMKDDGGNVFLDWRNCEKGKNKNFDVLMAWLEWILSHSLLRIAESTLLEFDRFWLSQGAKILLSLMQSEEEEVQERAATGIATFVVTDEENANIDPERAESVMKGGGVKLLLNLASSWREGLQAESAKAIANLSVNSGVARSVAEEGGITILTNLAKSMNKQVAEEAAGGLWNLSVGEEHKGAITEAGGVKALVDLIFKWSADGDGLLERAAGALANLAADDKCSMEVSVAGGVHALAARALANLAAHGDSNNNNAAVGQEAGALEALVQLTRSENAAVRQEAAGALWNLSFDDRNREAIAAAGGVEALVALAQACSDASPGLQERAAGALWGLSVSEANSIAIGREGGVPPLIALARSEMEDVHETAAGALWNLAFNPGNALRIVEEGGVPGLVHLCSSSESKMARFMAALALAYMFDGRMDEVAVRGISAEGSSKGVNLEGARRMALKHIEAFVLSFVDPQAFSTAAASSGPAALAQIMEAARINEAGHLRCSNSEIARFIGMLRNQSSILKACAAFALLQFTIPGGRHAMHHAKLLQNAGAARVLRSSAAAATAPLEAKILARIILRNLEHHQIDASL